MRHLKILQFAVKRLNKTIILCNYVFLFILIGLIDYCMILNGLQFRIKAASSPVGGAVALIRWYRQGRRRRRCGEGRGSDYVVLGPAAAVRSVRQRPAVRQGGLVQRGRHRAHAPGAEGVSEPGGKAARAFEPARSRDCHEASNPQLLFRVKHPKSIIRPETNEQPASAAREACTARASGHRISSH